MRKVLFAVAVIVALIGAALTAWVWPPVGIHDIGGEWEVARELLTSGTVQTQYTSGASNAYPLPLELLLVPFGLLDQATAAVVGRVVAAALIAAALWLWSPRWSVVLPALIALPAVEAVAINHVMSALGLFGMSLAVWAWQRERWFLCGLALALGSIRLANAIPLGAALLLSVWWRGGSVPRFVLGALSLLAPLTVAAFVLDPQWPHDYIANLAVFGVAGAVQVAMRWGTVGELVLIGVLAVLAAVATRFRSKDGLAIAMALSIFGAPMQSPYTAIFGLPALVQVATRPGYLEAAWVVNVAIWIAFAAAVATNTVYLTSAVGLLLLLGAYPLFRSSAGPSALRNEVLHGPAVSSASP